VSKSAPFQEPLCFLICLAGLLAYVPFALEWHLPTGKMVTEWRLLVPAEVMESVFWEAAGPLIGDDEPSAVLLAGWRCARPTGCW
jgi:hypothetical protein